MDTGDPHMKDKLTGCIDTVVHGALVLNRGYEDLLAAADLARFDRLWHYNDGQVVKSNAERSVLRFSLSIQGNTRVFYLKRHVPEYCLLGRLFGAILPNIFGSGGRREFANLCSFRRAGLSTATPVAFGERFLNLFQVESFLVTEDFAPYVALEKIILHRPDSLRGEVHAEKRRGLLDVIAAYARAMHASGYNHQDFNATHILVHDLDDSPPKIALFDLQRMNRNPFTRFRWLIKAFAELNYTLPASLFSEDDLLYLFHAYKDKQHLNLLDRLQWLWIQRKTRRIAKHTEKRRNQD